jgi:hypothetical protein
MGDKLRELGASVQWNTELVGLTQQRRQVTATLKQPDGTSATRRRLGRRMRRRAQRGARAQPASTFPGAPYEHVFFVADDGGDGQHGGRRGQRLPVAGRLPSAVPDARQGSLAHRRHPAAGVADRDRTSSIEAVCPSLRREAGAGLSIKSCTWFSTYRIHHRSAPSVSATGAASCSAMRRTSIARWARKA